jgi:hypothetical protein
MANSGPTAGEMLAVATWDEHKAELSQVIFEVAGFPMQDALLFCDVTEERRGEHGRFLVATQAIPAFTFLRTPKVRLAMAQNELDALHLECSVFNRQAVPELVGFPALFSVLVQEEDIPHGSDLLCFVGKFLREGLLDNAMVRDLMDYDAFDKKSVTETLSRLRIGDVLWLHFWRQTFEGVFAADTVWRVFSFILSHPFMNDVNVLTFSPFCKANCPQKRWDWYLAGCNEAAPPVPLNSSGIEQLLGNFEEIAPWGRQTTVGPGQIPADECVVVMKDVAVGDEVLLDYGETYMLEPEKQLLQFRGDVLERLVVGVLAGFDPRVLAAFRAYMASV